LAGGSSRLIQPGRSQISGRLYGGDCSSGRLLLAAAGGGGEAPGGGPKSTLRSPPENLTV